MTTTQRPSRTTVRPSFFGSLALPFIVPVTLTFLLIALVGEGWPRNLAQGSGLKLAGLTATAFTSLLAWKFTVRDLTDIRASKAAALLATVTGLMGWPVWTVGFLPSINGIHVEDQQTVTMILKKLETTTVSRSDKRNHWAWLQPVAPSTIVKKGRYFVSQQTYNRWEREKPQQVNLIIGRGMLGAQVVLQAD